MVLSYPLYIYRWYPCIAFPNLHAYVGPRVELVAISFPLDLVHSPLMYMSNLKHLLSTHFFKSALFIHFFTCSLWFENIQFRQHLLAAFPLSSWCIIHGEWILHQLHCTVLGQIEGYPTYPTVYPLNWMVPIVVASQNISSVSINWYLAHNSMDTHSGVGG